jgi:hypothetical protein
MMVPQANPMAEVEVERLLVADNVENVSHYLIMVEFSNFSSLNRCLFYTYITQSNGMERSYARVMIARFLNRISAVSDVALLAQKGSVWVDCGCFKEAP